MTRYVICLIKLLSIYLCSLYVYIHILYTNHKFFQDVFFLAQFGDGDIIPRINLQDRTIKMSEQKFQGDVLLSVEDVVKHMNASKSLKTWVQLPDSSGSSRYPSPNCDGGYYQNASNLNWYRISPRSLKELNDLIYTTSCSGRSYGWRTNNCQHFAIEMYNKS